MSQSTSLAGTTALVTGAATGIGHRGRPGSALAIAEISDRAEYQDMVERLLGEYGRWDVLVNNAAVAVTKPFSEITEEEFDRSFAVNVKAVFHGLQLAWDHLADEGRIITVSSSTTALMLPGYAVNGAHFRRSYSAICAFRSSPSLLISSLRGQSWAKLLTGQSHAHAPCASLHDGLPLPRHAGRHAEAAFGGAQAGPSPS